MAVAAGLLLLFALTRLADIGMVAPDKGPSIAKNEISDKKSSVQQPKLIQQNSGNRNSIQPANSSASSTNTEFKATPVRYADVQDDFNKIYAQTISEPDYAIKNVTPDEIAVAELPEFINRTNVVTTVNYNSPITSANKISSKSPTYYTPKESKTKNPNNHFALAMDYQPENINNGSGTSLFHNVGLTASYDKEKVRFNSSIGMAYNQENYEFELSYDKLQPITAIGPNGRIDTIRYEVTNVASDVTGTLNHRYLTYNLGIGRKLFSFGKFSSWLNAGAGFAVQLNQANERENAANTLKIQYNAKVYDVSEMQSQYNPLNINFITAIDFNYTILKHVSINLAPVSRWYFKPVLTRNSQPTDEFTIGFRTGMKFAF